LIQTYHIWLELPGKNTMHYCGYTFGDTSDAESRIRKELTCKPPNKDFAAAVQEHGPYVFQWEMTGNHDTEMAALEKEAADIELFMSWHPEHGWNKVRGIDKKRLHRAQEADALRPTIQAMLDAGWIDFRNSSAEAWASYDSPANVTLISDYAKKEKCSIATAFHFAREAGLLLPVAA